MTDRYQCPHCKVSVSTGIKLSTPPTHKCQKRANRVIALDLVKTKEKTPTE